MMMMMMMTMMTMMTIMMICVRDVTTTVTLHVRLHVQQLHLLQRSSAEEATRGGHRQL